MKKFINIADIDKKDLRLIIDNAKLRKEKRSSLNKNAIDPDAPLEGKILIMLLTLFQQETKTHSILKSF